MDRCFVRDDRNNGSLFRVVVDAGLHHNVSFAFISDEHIDNKHSTTVTSPTSAGN